jgi:hypothetical protein
MRRREILKCLLVVGIQASILGAQSSADPGDALLDGLVWGTDVTVVTPDVYAQPLRAEVEQYLRRAGAYRSRRAPPSDSELKMVYEAQVRYESRLAAASADVNAPALAAAYVDSLRPCYEWEGFHDCPEHEARFADDYQAAHPNGPFSAYLRLLAAHRWLCATEAYDYEKRATDAERSRRLYEQRLAVARASTVLLIRTAADRLAARGRCFASR